MELQVRKLSKIKPYRNNPRKNDGAVDAVCESIRQCGYIAPIIVDEQGEILAGHTRYKALKKLGKTECEVIVKSGLTEEQKKKYRLLDNKTNELAGWDFELLDSELAELDFEGYDFGFDIETEPENGKERKSVDYKETISIVIDCKSDEEAEKIFKALSEEGYECRISTL